MTDTALHNVVRRMAFLNLGYFCVEFVVALSIGSVSLFARQRRFSGRRVGQPPDPDGTRLERPQSRPAMCGMALAAILLVPGLAPSGPPGRNSWPRLRPNPLPLSLAGLGALAINLSCAMMLVRFPRAQRQPHPRRFSLCPQ